MPIKFVIQKIDDESSVVEKLFEDVDRITIGRDSSSDLRLLDEDKMVSRTHAEVRKEGTQYGVVDLGSRNLTYLRGEPIKPNTWNPLSDGDSFQIANFEVRFHAEEDVPDDLDRTVWLDFDNPLLEAASTLIETLGSMASRYEDLPAGRRESALQEAIESAVPSIEADPFATGLLVALLRNQAEPVVDPLAPFGEEAGASDSAEPDVSPQQVVEPLSVGDWTDSAGAKDLSRMSRAEIEAALKLLLPRAAELVSMADRFRYEFIGTTLMPKAGDFSWEELDSALRDSLVHEIALLDGYKAAALEGGRYLLNEMDPDAVLEKLQDESRLFRLLPFLAHGAVVRNLRDKVRRTRKDVEILEVRVFRPAFLKAYLARQNAGQGQSEPEDR